MLRGKRVQKLQQSKQDRMREGLALNVKRLWYAQRS
jgi:hypothetical protein